MNAKAVTHTMLYLPNDQFLTVQEKIGVISEMLRNPERLHFDVTDEWGAKHTINPVNVSRAQELPKPWLDPRD